MTYTPLGVGGIDTLSVQVSDGQAFINLPVTVEIIFEAENNPPVAQPDQGTVNELSTRLDVLANDSDPDGDSLAYKLCTPYHGGSMVTPAPNPPSAPPYTLVSYASGYSYLNPLPANPAIAIDPSTGLLTGTPTLIGQYVVGVCVEEYRNGVLIGTHRRDFQFNVASCNKTTVAAIPIPVVGDTSINECTGFTIHFGNNSIGATSYYWDFGVGHLTNDTSTVKFPTYIYPDTGTYRAMLIANPGTACSDTDFVTVKVYPVLEARFGAMDACAKAALQFSDSSSSTMGSLTAWLWNFGDGNSSSNPNPSHIYTQGGIYPVTLTIENSVGCEATVSRNVTIHPSPHADFTVEWAVSDGDNNLDTVRLALTDLSDGETEDSTTLDVSGNPAAVRPLVR